MVAAVATVRFHPDQPGSFENRQMFRNSLPRNAYCVICDEPDTQLVQCLAWRGREFLQQDPADRIGKGPEDSVHTDTIGNQQVAWKRLGRKTAGYLS